MEVCFEWRMNISVRVFYVGSSFWHEENVSANFERTLSLMYYILVRSYSSSLCRQICMFIASNYYLLMKTHSHSHSHSHTHKTHTDLQQDFPFVNVAFVCAAGITRIDCEQLRRMCVPLTTPMSLYTPSIAIRSAHVYLPPDYATSDQ